MSVTYTDNLKAWEVGYALVQQAQRRLEKVLGASASLVTVDWDRTQDSRGRAAISLRLKDHTGEVSGTLTLDELRSEHLTDFRLYRLWSDLLQIEIRKRIAEMSATEG